MTKKIKGIILYKCSMNELTEKDYGVIRLIEAAKKRNVEIDVLKPDQFEIIISRNDTRSILIDDKPEPLPDFVIPRRGSSTSFYAFAVIRQLQNLGVYVCNDAKAINSVQDKLYMHQKLAYSKLASPKTMLAKFPISSEIVKRELGFPVVIKNVTGTHGKGIYLCENEDKFTDVMELIYTNNSEANIILQEFVKNSFGRDLRVFVIGGQVVACMERKSLSSFKANFTRGGEVHPYKITPEIEWMASETAKLFNLDVAGVDLLFDESGFKVCEANSSPGFCGLEKVVGNVIAEQIIDYILIKLGVH